MAIMLPIPEKPPYALSKLTAALWKANLSDQRHKVSAYRYPK